MTYNPVGQLIRQLDRNSQIDGKPNCISNPVVDKNNVVYGVPGGRDSNGYYTYGPNLLAYAGNTLKWKYPLSCGGGYSAPQVAVGATGNIYAIAFLGDGMHLIGIASELRPGQTQPDKVMDVKIPGSSCNDTLHPYKHGIMVHGQSMYPHYYSYGGKFLGQALIGNYWNLRINSAGKLFADTHVTGTIDSYKVSMYDPQSGRVVWTTQASTLNADAQGIELYPLASGGVLAAIWEQRVDGGAPVPNEYVYKLVTLNADGRRSEPVQLPNTDANGYKFEPPQITPQANGKVLVIRHSSIPTGEWGEYVRAIAVGIYDPVSRTWGYQQVMKGNTQEPDEIYGYSADSYMPAGGTVYLVAIRCNGAPGGCARQQQKLYALKVPGAAIDYPRGAVLSANTGYQPAPQSYVALGDSFSSGEGVPPFIDITTCHRSYAAYAYMLSRDPYLSPELETSTQWVGSRFVACSGAQTTHVLNGWYDDTHSEPRQLDALLSGSPKIATITIGGNDVRLMDFAIACVLRSCNFTSDVYSASCNLIDTTLEAKLETTYKELLRVTKAAQTKIKVIGYPYVVAYKTASDPPDRRCGYMSGEPTFPNQRWEETRATRDIIARLNIKITETVEKVRLMDPDNQRLEFVSATMPDGPFAGHEACSTGESYFNNIDQVANDYHFVFHPNQKGQAAYARLVRVAIGE